MISDWISSGPIARWQRRFNRSGWLLADRLVRMGVGFFVGVAIARLLGPANYGTFAYATALATLFLPVLSLGLERVVIRDLARRPEQRPVLLGTTILLRLAGGIVSFFLAVAGALFVQQANNVTCWLVAVIAAGNVFMAADVVDWAFQSDGRFRLPVLLRLSCFVAGSVARVLLAKAGAPLVAIAAAMLAESAIVAGLLLLSARRVREAPLPQWRIQWALAGELLRVSWPLLLAEVGTWVFQRLDLLILNHYTAEAEVGLYAAATRVAQAGFFIPIVAVQVMAPDAARIPDAKAVLPLITRGMSILATVGLGLSLVTSVCAPWVVPLLFGARYHDAVPLILILTWSNVFVFVGCFHALYLVSVNRQDVSLRLSWVTASCSLGLNLLLIPRWHAIGAAFAALAAYAITTTFGVVLFTASRPLWRANWIAYIAPFRFLQQNLARRKDSANIES